MEIIFTDAAKDYLYVMGARFMTIYSEMLSSC